MSHSKFDHLVTELENLHRPMWANTSPKHATLICRECSYDARTRYVAFPCPTMERVREIKKH